MCISINLANKNIIPKVATQTKTPNINLRKSPILFIMYNPFLAKLVQYQK
ncbi:hypothetical protein CCYN49044_340028 [Capnocytophaga cynodegmi]|uniref:Uncharacterized protein n=1 Tax=Capnocytophaga cynodegmi TaxID=28189 RepID=A0A0B7HKZ9_9FLAO|nr:hypothetical protein CCYN49044_340028 [Capnocytophaga cynodegmi]CEN42031.1 hypothetical protein CCYN74_90028 [Capnocytophaga cynodegmi]